MHYLSRLAWAITLLLWGWEGPAGAMPPPAEAMTPSPPSRTITPDARTLVDSNTQFALDLYKLIASREGNQFFAPQSISTALAQAYAGARAQTAEQMARVLHFSLPPQRLHPAFTDLISFCRSEHASCALHSANALWTHVDAGILPEFVSTLRRHYGVGVGTVDFRRANEQARQLINGWVDQQTRGTIKELLAPGMLARETALVLVNAVYFKGAWATPFDAQSTEVAPFHLTPAYKVQVPLMYQHDSFSYAATETFQAVELPYAGENLSMVVLLPKKMDGLAELEKSLSKKWLDDCLASLSKQDLLLHLPRFKMSESFFLQETLAAMGMHDAFNPKEADFRLMSDREPRLYISAVLHKAFVEVNEKGTEAAAATAVMPTLGAAPSFGPPPAPPPVFRADHPFLFLIRENRSGSILFIGRVSDPRS